MALEVQSNTAADSTRMAYSDPNITTQKGDSGRIHHAASSKAMNSATLGQASADQLREIGSKMSPTQLLATPNVAKSDDAAEIQAELTEKLEDLQVTLGQTVRSDSTLTGSIMEHRSDVTAPTQKSEIDQQSGGKTSGRSLSENAPASSGKSAKIDGATVEFAGQNAINGSDLSSIGGTADAKSATIYTPDGKEVDIFELMEGKPTTGGIVTRMNPAVMNNSAALMERLVEIMSAVTETQNETQKNLQLSSLKSVVTAYGQKLEAAGKRLEAAKETAAGMQQAGITKIAGGAASIGFGLGGFSKDFGGVFTGGAQGGANVTSGLADMTRASYDLRAAQHTFEADNLSARADFTSTMGQNAATSAANIQRSLQKIQDSVSSLLSAMNQTTTTIAQNIRS